MNIYTVRDNLKNTIEGKELLLAKWRKVEFKSPEAANAMDTMINMLELNISDLVKILADVETCCIEHNEMSWRLNPDRSGGQFTQDELYDNNRDGWIEP
jgi:hypothetical protein